MKFRSSLFPLLLVGVLAALTFWLQRIAEPGNADVSGHKRHDPDFIIDNFSVRRFGPEGNLQHTLRSIRMVHYPDDDSTVATLPDVTFHRVPPSRLSADSAWVSTDAKEVRLDGNVRLVRTGLDALDTVVTTTRLSIFPDEETARSDAPVTVTQGQSVINGTGLAVDNKASIIKLLGPVRGIIHRQSGKSP